MSNLAGPQPTVFGPRSFVRYAGQDPIRGKSVDPNENDPKNQEYGDEEA